MEAFIEIWSVKAMKFNYAREREREEKRVKKQNDRLIIRIVLSTYSSQKRKIPSEKKEAKNGVAMVDMPS